MLPLMQCEVKPAGCSHMRPFHIFTDGATIPAGGLLFAAQSITDTSEIQEYAEHFTEQDCPNLGGGNLKKIHKDY